MKKLISLALSALLVLTTLPALAADPAADTSWYGDGSASEFTISSAADLLGLASLVNGGTTFEGKVIRLGNNISLSGINWIPIGDIKHRFKGEFDGQSHTISGLSCINPDIVVSNNVLIGLFGNTESAYIHSFTLSSSQLRYDAGIQGLRCGTVAASAWCSVFKDITVTTPAITINSAVGIEGLYAGGAFGEFAYSQAENVNVASPSIQVNSSSAHIGGHTGMAERGNVDKDGKIHDPDVDDRYYPCNAHWLPGTVSGETVALNVFRNCHVTGNVAEPATITAEGDGLSVGGFLGTGIANTSHPISPANLFSNCTVSGLAMTCTGKSEVRADVAAGGFAGGIGSNNAVSSGHVFISGFEGCSASGTMTINPAEEGNYDCVNDPASGFGGFVGVSYADKGLPSYQGADASGMTINISPGVKYVTSVKTEGNTIDDNPNKRAGSFVGYSSMSTYMGCRGGSPGAGTNELAFSGNDSASTSGLKITPALLNLGTHVVQSYSGVSGTFTLENIGDEAYSLIIPAETDHFIISCGPEIGGSSPADSPAVASLTGDDGVTIVPGKSRILTVTPKEGLEIGRYTDIIDIKTTGDEGELLGTVAATIEIIAPAPSTGIDLWYNGGNSFGSSKSAVPTSVEIDGQPVGFVGDGGEFSVSCLQPGARWITVKWHSTTVTTSFTPDMNAHCDTVAIPKTGDMPLFASILAWLGL